MKQPQPNFEELKTRFYEAFIYNSTEVSKEVCIAVLKETIHSCRLLPSFQVRYNHFRKDFHKWLDSLDIRQAGALIDILKTKNVSLPGWIKDKYYHIDYNDQGHLDLIKPEKLCKC